VEARFPWPPVGIKDAVQMVVSYGEIAKGKGNSHVLFFILIFLKILTSSERARLFIKGGIK